MDVLSFALPPPIAYNVLIDNVTDPANVEYILKTNFANHGKGWYHYGILSDVLGDGIFAVDGENGCIKKRYRAMN
ncbi:hypothetical protein PS1_001788 [Malus domestica]